MSPDSSLPSAPPETPTPAAKWREMLFGAAKRHAKGVDGQLVLIALEKASDEVWDAGLDEEFTVFGLLDSEHAAVFDITWLSVFICHLVEVARPYRELEERRRHD